MALGGVLARADWTEEQVVAFVQVVIQSAQPGDRDAYAKVSGDTRAAFAKLQRNEPATGLPRLAELVGSDIVDVIAKWLGLDPKSDAFAAALVVNKVGRESASTKLVNLARELTELFHSGDSCYATFAVAEHRETHALNSRGFRRWLMGMFFERQKRAAGGEAITSAIATLEGFSRFNCEERDVFVRVAGHNGKNYLDLCDAHWRVIEIEKQDWRVIESKDCPVRFRRAHGMLALPVPERGGKIGELRPFLNIACDDDFVMAVAWLLGSLHPSGPYPILILHGEQGSAKSTAATVLRNLIDPNLAPRRTEPREARDLMIAANNGFVVSFDNLSHLKEWLSDGLCRLSTGGGFGTRSLYTNDEEIIFEAKRPAILNSIEELATRGDLLSRSLILYLPRVRDEKRRTESEFWTAFEIARPRLLGALLDAATAALRNAGSVKLQCLPRMADFAAWVHAAEMSLPWKSGTFLRVYAENGKTANDLPLETPVADAMRKLILPWNGTATQLLADLEEHASERTRKLKSWPTSGRLLSNELRRLAPNLRPARIHIEFDRGKNRARSRMIYITSESEGNPSSVPSALSNSHTPHDDNSDDGSDDGPNATGGTPSDVSSSPPGVSDGVDDVDDEKHSYEDTTLVCRRCGNVETNHAAARYHAQRLCPASKN